MPPCAFCPYSAKLSAEHIWSEWMRDLLPIKRFRFYRRDENRVPVTTWNKSNLDVTAKVVCKRCNEGWMSDLESSHAKVALQPLILGDQHITISEKRSRSLALFAFKTAVVIDHMGRDGNPFF